MEDIKTKSTQNPTNQAYCLMPPVEYWGSEIFYGAPTPPEGEDRGIYTQEQYLQSAVDYWQNYYSELDSNLYKMWREDFEQIKTKHDGSILHSSINSSKLPRNKVENEYNIEKTPQKTEKMCAKKELNLNIFDLPDSPINQDLSEIIENKEANILFEFTPGKLLNSLSQKSLFTNKFSQFAPIGQERKDKKEKYENNRKKHTSFKKKIKPNANTKTDTEHGYTFEEVCDILKQCLVNKLNHGKHKKNSELLKFLSKSDKQINKAIRTFVHQYKKEQISKSKNNICLIGFGKDNFLNFTKKQVGDIKSKFFDNKHFWDVNLPNNNSLRRKKTHENSAIYANQNNFCHHVAQNDNQVHLGSETYQLNGIDWINAYAKGYDPQYYNTAGFFGHMHHHDHHQNCPVHDMLKMPDYNVVMDQLHNLQLYETNQYGKFYEPVQNLYLQLSFKKNHQEQSIPVPNQFYTVVPNQYYIPIDTNYVFDENQQRYPYLYY